VLVGTLAEIWRYPIKSMQGERLERALIGPEGIPGDRGAAVIDVQTGHVISGKRIETLVTARASSAKGGPVITLPDGQVLVPGADTDAALSAWLGRPVRLSLMASTARPVIDSEGGRTFHGRAGSFFDSSPIHLVTTATLAFLSTLYPGGDFDPRRFRPNLLIDTGELVGPVEQDWTGCGIVIGGVAVEVTRPCSRCIMTTSEQAELPKDRGILGVIEREQEGNVGVHCRAVVGEDWSAEIASGDAVELVLRAQPGTRTT
jgi:hypothetical protein